MSPHRTNRRYTAQKQPIEIIIRYPHHPRAGERIPVLRRTTYADGVHFVVERPDGFRSAIPGWMTEPWAATLPEVNIPRLSLPALEDLCRIVEISHVLPFPSSKTNQNGEDDGTASSTPATRSVDVNGRSPPATRHGQSRGDHPSAQTTSQRIRHRPRSESQGGK